MSSTASGSRSVGEETWNVTVSPASSVTSISSVAASGMQPVGEQAHVAQQ